MIRYAERGSRGGRNGLSAGAFFVLALLLAALVAFARQWAAPEVIGMSALVLLMVTGTLDFDEAMLGFSHPALITVVAMFVLGSSLVKTGVADRIGSVMGRLAGTTEIGLIVVMMLTVSLMSSFMNNIAATVILLPVAHRLARSAGIASTRVLIPLSFGSLLGGTLTLVGTTPNLIASGVLQEAGFPGFRMFDYLPTGAAILGIGIVFMVLIGRHLLPRRDNDGDLLDKYRLREYLTEVTVRPDSWLIGKSLAEADLSRQIGVRVLGVVRGGHIRLQPPPAYVLAAGDVLLVEASVDDMMVVRQKTGVDIHPEAKLGREDLVSEHVQLIEAVVSPESALRGRTPEEVAFRHRYGLTILALKRHGETASTRLHRTRLRLGDVLLLQGAKERFDALRAQVSPDLMLLDPLPYESPRTNKTWPALGIMAATIGVAAFDLLPVAAVATIGALLMILTGSIRIEEVYEAIEWKVVFLIASLLPLGLAMEKTGLTVQIARWLAVSVGRFGPLPSLAAVFVLTTMLAQVLSNSATTLLLAPLALTMAAGLDAKPQPFVLAVAIGASTAFLTPIGHQANALVYSAGDYKFTDFTRVGLPLVLCIFILVLWIVPKVWPF